MVRVIVNGEVRQVGSVADVLQTSSDSDELILVVERPGNTDQFAQAAGSKAHGFVVSTREGGIDHVTKNHALRPSTVVAMLDAYARNEPSWSTGVAWDDDAAPSGGSRRVVLTMLFGSLAMVGAVLAVLMLRTRVTVRYLCGRDGRIVDSVEPVWGSRYGGTARSTCTFTDGTEVDLSEVVGTRLDLAEAALSFLLVPVLAVALWLLLARLIRHL